MDIPFTERSELVDCGKLYTFEIAMTPIPDGRKRTIRVWLPEIYDGVRRFPVLYMHDGQYVFPDNGPMQGMGSWQFFDELLNKAAVVVTPGSGFGPAGEGYFRITSFADRDRTIEAMQRIKNIL